MRLLSSCLGLGCCTLAIVVEAARVTHDLISSSSRRGKEYLSVMTWNVEKLDGAEAEKTTYINELVIESVVGNQVDVVFLQEARSCADMAEAVQATGMACVGSTVEPAYEDKRSFTVLGGLILYSQTTLTRAPDTKNRAIETKGKYRYQGKLEWKRWINDRTVADRHGRSLQDVWSDSAAGCTWSAYKEGNGCNSVYPDIPITNSVKLYLKSGEWSDTLVAAFPNGIRPMNIHLFSGGHNRDGLTQRAMADRRAFQMRALVWMNYIWNYNDKYSADEDPPVTIYAGDFNTIKKADIDPVLAPGADYGPRLWKASDSLRTHGGGGYLDHVVLSEGPQLDNVVLRSSTEMSKQTVRSKDAPNSDHDPLFIKIYATKRTRMSTAVNNAAWSTPSTVDQGEPQNTQGASKTEESDENIFNGDEFPSLGS